MISARSPRGGQRGFWAGLLLACCATGGAAQEQAVLKRAAELREAPSETARSLAPLPADTAVTRLPERSGAWVQVRNAAGATGWVHMFDVRPAGATGTGNAATGALRGVTGLFTSGGTQRATSPTSTIGIRGLGAQDLAQAQPNPAAVTQMEALRQSEAQARDFAGAASLASASVPALPAPARPRAAEASGGNPGQMP